MQFTKTDLNKTVRAKPDELEKNRQRYTVDANWMTLGRLAAEIAKHLIGKHKPCYCDFWDAGDFIIVQNADKVTVTGRKHIQKMYYSYSGRKGNVKSINFQDLMKKHPEKALWFAVRGMLPKNKLRQKRMKRLKSVVWTTTKYDHLQPQPLLNDK